MRIGKKDFFDALRDIEKETKMYQENEKQFNKIIIGLIPKALQHINDIFKALCDKPLVPIEKERDIVLYKHFDNSQIGKVQINELQINLENQSIKFKLNGGIGYVGATAKVEVIPDNIHLPREKAPYLDNGIYIGINVKEEKFETYWIIDNKRVLLDEDNAMQLLYDLFVGKRRVKAVN
ncbi:MAG TPA: hypothetical protein VM054_06630 [bacterium]|nr:hypothetical protein [bacterium]